MRYMIVAKDKMDNTIDASNGVELACTQIMRLHNSAFTNTTRQFTPVLSLTLTIQQLPSTLIASAPHNWLKRGNDHHTVCETCTIAMNVIST
jgi:hypothetical protein